MRAGPNGEVDLRVGDRVALDGLRGRLEGVVAELRDDPPMYRVEWNDPARRQNWYLPGNVNREPRHYVQWLGRAGCDEAPATQRSPSEVPAPHVLCEECGNAFPYPSPNRYCGQCRALRGMFR